MIFKASATGVIDIAGRAARCALGKGGVKAAADKREGDGASPIGVWPIRRVLFRPDRGVAPATALAAAPIAQDDGWCDAPADPAYNRPVKLPHPASAEHMWMASHVYDLVVVLGHNDDPVVPQMGSAIFLHLATPDYGPTAGCVAVSRPDMLDILAHARPGDAVEIAA
ncbi:MAG: hypothetical protein JWO33_360 [Caulobacteraceae bacterium]|nr:hypothetical protein [Caulobacteraceae bacterium]